MTRRFDLEMDNLEAVWLQLKLQGKKVLFGTFYIPPNSNQDIWFKLENTFDMALNDNSVDYIMATGDLNENQFNSSNSKIKSLLAQFSLIQLIDTPTHFTEHSSSLIDVFMTNNVNYVTYCGVGPPLQDLTRYHCPIICFLNIPKISQKTSHQYLSDVDWDSLISSNNVNDLTTNITNAILYAAELCINSQ